MCVLGFCRNANAAHSAVSPQTLETPSKKGGLDPREIRGTCIDELQILSGGRKRQETRPAVIHVGKIGQSPQDQVVAIADRGLSWPVFWLDQQQKLRLPKSKKIKGGELLPKTRTREQLETHLSYKIGIRNSG